MENETVQKGTGIDWTALASQTLDQMMTPMLLAIGIALSVWIVILGVSAFRKFVKF